MRSATALCRAVVPAPSVAVFDAHAWRKPATSTVASGKSRIHFTLTAQRLLVGRGAGAAANSASGWLSKDLPVQQASVELASIRVTLTYGGNGRLGVGLLGPRVGIQVTADRTCQQTVGRTSYARSRPLSQA